MGDSTGNPLYTRVSSRLIHDHYRLKQSGKMPAPWRHHMRTLWRSGCLFSAACAEIGQPGHVYQVEQCSVFFVIA